MQRAGETPDHADVALRTGAGNGFSNGQISYALPERAPLGNGPSGPTSGIEVRLHELIAARGMTLAELSQRVGVTVVNLSVLKNGHARAIRFSTLAKLCQALDCQPGELLSWRASANTPAEESAAETEAAGRRAEAR